VEGLVTAPIENFDDVVATIKRLIDDGKLFTTPSVETITWSRSLVLADVFDSLDSFELMMSFEDELNISVPVSVAAEIRTLGEFSDAVLNCAAAKVAA
jgi:acyl carrier protein